jgi:hypothetical protein
MKTVYGKKIPAPFSLTGLSFGHSLARPSSTRAGTLQYTIVSFFLVITKVKQRR